MPIIYSLSFARTSCFSQHRKRELSYSPFNFIFRAMSTEPRDTLSVSPATRTPSRAPSLKKRSISLEQTTKDQVGGTTLDERLFRIYPINRLQFFFGLCPTLDFFPESWIRLQILKVTYTNIQICNWLLFYYNMSWFSYDAFEITTRLYCIGHNFLLPELDMEVGGRKQRVIDAVARRRRG